MNESYIGPQEKNAETIAWLEQNLTPSDTFKGDQRHFDLKTVIPLAQSEGSAHKIESSMIGIIQAGVELFGVIATRKDGKVSFVLSRYRQGERGQLVTVLNAEKPRLDTVGRDIFTDRGDEADNSLSRNHFSISLDEGLIKVRDNHSTNGTKLFAHLTSDTDADKSFQLDAAPLFDGGWLPTSQDLKDFV